MISCVYVDIDMTLADTHKGLDDMVGPHWRNLTRNQVFKEMSKIEHFFLKLEAFPGAREFVQELIDTGLDISILGALAKPRLNLATARVDKTVWIREHIHETIPTYLIYEGMRKAFWFADHASLLIDDKPENIKAWENEGGFGILHRDFESTRRQLRELGVLNK